VVDYETVTRKADFKVTVEWVNCNLQQEKGTVKRCSDWAWKRNRCATYSTALGRNYPW